MTTAEIHSHSNSRIRAAIWSAGNDTRTVQPLSRDRPARASTSSSSRLRSGDRGIHRLLAPARRHRLAEPPRAVAAARHDRAVAIPDRGGPPGIEPLVLQQAEQVVGEQPEAHDVKQPALAHDRDRDVVDEALGGEAGEQVGDDRPHRPPHAPPGSPDCRSSPAPRRRAARCSPAAGPRRRSAPGSCGRGSLWPGGRRRPNPVQPATARRPASAARRCAARCRDRPWRSARRAPGRSGARAGRAPARPSGRAAPPAGRARARR